MPYILDTSPANLMAGYQTSPLARGIQGFQQGMDTAYQRQVDDRRLSQQDRELDLREQDIALDEQVQAQRMQSAQERQAQMQQSFQGLSQSLFSEADRMLQAGAVDEATVARWRTAVMGGSMQGIEKGVQAALDALMEAAEANEAHAQRLKGGEELTRLLEGIAGPSSEAGGGPPSSGIAMPIDAGQRYLAEQAIQRFMEDRQDYDDVAKVITNLMPKPEKPQSESEKMREEKQRRELERDANQPFAIEVQMGDEEDPAQVIVPSEHYGEDIDGKQRRVSEAPRETLQWYLAAAMELLPEGTDDEVRAKAAEMMRAAHWRKQ